MRLGIDAMSGDNAPVEIVKGGVESLNEIKADIVFIGDENVIKEELAKYSFDKNRVSIIHASEVITNDDKPVKGIKSKKDSSMVVGLKKVREKELDGFVSAGNTGALLVGGLLKVGRIKGVDRPALATVLPTYDGFTVMVDAGANSECKPRNLREFAIMGSVYSKNVLEVKNPRVGLINVGTEEGKGNALVIEAFDLLKEEESINFTGNMEARTIMDGDIDVVVCDGFTGNVILKTLEGTAITIGQMLKDMFMSSTMTKLSGLMVKGPLKDFKKRLDYKEYGGAPLLGINGNVVKAHGSSNAKALKNAVIYSEKFAQNSVIEEIAEVIRE